MTIKYFSFCTIKVMIFCTNDIDDDMEYESWRRLHNLRLQHVEHIVIASDQQAVGTSPLHNKN